MRWAASAAIVGTLAVATGCQDAPTDPMVGVVAEDVGGALALGVELPSPAAVASSEASAAAAARAWEASWSLPPEAGRTQRESTYRPVAEALALSPADVAEGLDRLGAALSAVDALGVEALPPGVRDAVHRADALRSRALRALRAGDTASAAEDLLRGSDALREVGPRAMALAWVSEAEAMLGRISADGSYSTVDVERARRLAHGARIALRDGDFARAIRRAYYARQLLKPRP